MFKTSKIKSLIHLMAALAFGAPAVCLSAETWGINLYSFKDEVRATVTENGEGKYTLLFGYGGSVSAILDHEKAYSDQLAGPYNDEETDRILQTVLWGVSRNANIGTRYPTRWNVNQAGTFENLPAQIVSFNVVTNQRLEVYSVNGNQWYQHLDDDYQGSQPVSQYTRYTCEPGGVLGVRTITRIPQIHVSGAERESFKAYIEHWSAFKNTFGTNGFNAVAIRATPEGVPNWWYSTTDATGSHGALPDYPNWPLRYRSLDGYAFAYNTRGVSKHTVAAMLFGRDRVQRPASRAYCQSVLNFKYWLAPNVNPGIGILPGIYVDQALPGTLVDFEFKLILRSGSNAEFMTQLTKSTEQLLPPRVYEPDEAVPPELKPIQRKLNEIIEEKREGLPAKAYWINDGVLHNALSP
jgi:hypothetical protein